MIAPESTQVEAWVARLIARDGSLAPRPATESRADLTERARSGDPEAFERLIRASGDHLLAVARKILRDPDGAEDALQQAVITAWRLMPRLRDADRFDAWLYRILVNACYREAKRRRRFAAQVRLVAVEPSHADGTNRVADRDELEQAFRMLSPEHRAVVVLHFFADLPLTEVAEIVSVSHGTARSRLHYAMRALRSALEAGERSDRLEAGR